MGSRLAHLAPHGSALAINELGQLDSRGGLPAWHEPEVSMSQLLGILHGREETFPPALLAELNNRHADIHGESITLASVEALNRSPYRIIIDRISCKVPYFKSFLHQQDLLGVPILPALKLHQLDRIGLAQLALLANVQALPTILLPHHTHPEGILSDDLSNLAYPMPWETYLQQLKLPAVLCDLRLGHGPRQRLHSLSELWNIYGQSGNRLLVLQPDLSEAEHFIAICLGAQVQILGFDPITSHYRPAPGALQEQIQAACHKLNQKTDFTLTALQFSYYRSKLYLSDLHLLPDLEWWSLGERAFSQIITHCVDECLRHTHVPKYIKQNMKQKR